MSLTSTFCRDLGFWKVQFSHPSCIDISCTHTQSKDLDTPPYNLDPFKRVISTWSHALRIFCKRFSKHHLKAAPQKRKKTSITEFPKHSLRAAREVSRVLLCWAQISTQCFSYACINTGLELSTCGHKAFKLSFITDTNTECLPPWITLLPDLAICTLNLMEDLGTQNESRQREAS